MNHKASNVEFDQQAILPIKSQEILVGEDEKNNDSRIYSSQNSIYYYITIEFILTVFQHFVKIIQKDFQKIDVDHSQISQLLNESSQQCDLSPNKILIKGNILSQLIISKDIQQDYSEEINIDSSKIKQEKKQKRLQLDKSLTSQTQKLKISYVQNTLGTIITKNNNQSEEYKDQISFQHKNESINKTQSKQRRYPIQNSNQIINLGNFIDLFYIKQLAFKNIKALIFKNITALINLNYIHCKYLLDFQYIYFRLNVLEIPSINLKKCFFGNSGQKSDFMKNINSRMVMFFKQNTYSGRLKELNEKVRDKIKDKADFVEGSREKLQHPQLTDKIWMYFINYLEKINIPLFNPEHKWRVGFNTFIVLFNCFYIYIMTLKIAFTYGSNQTWLYSLQQVAQVLWIADMLIQMNTAMYHDNEFTQDRKIIMKTFIKEYFFFEVLPIIFENLHSSSLYLNIIFHLPLLLKIKGIMIMLSNLEFYILQILENHSIFLLFKLFTKMIIFGHILACCRYSVVQYEIYISHQNIIWSSNYMNYQEDDHLVNYFNCMYWAFTIMLNVAHALPSTELEVLFTTCCMIISCIGFGYLLTAIGGILRELSQNSEDYKRDLSSLNNFMKRKKIEMYYIKMKEEQTFLKFKQGNYQFLMNIMILKFQINLITCQQNSGLKRRANTSLKKYYDNQLRIKINEEKSALDKIDNRMLRELLLASNQIAIKQCPMLSHIFSESTVQQICMNLEEIFLAPNQSLLDHQINQKEDQFLYFVIDGKIKVQEDYYITQNMQGQYTQDEYNKIQKVYNQFKNVGLLVNQNYSSSQNQVILKNGQYFGLIGFILGQNLIKQAQSLEYSTVLRISLSQVQRIVQSNTRDKETLLEIRQRLMYGCDVTKLNIGCDYCSSKDHLSQDCFLIHFNKRNPFIFSKFNYCPQQLRDIEFSRRQKQYFNALNFFKYNQECMEELRNNYGYNSENDLDESYLNVTDDSFQSQQEKSQINNNQGYSKNILYDRGDDILHQSNHGVRSKGNSIILDEGEDFYTRRSSDSQDIETYKQKSTKRSKKSKLDKSEKVNQQIQMNEKAKQKIEEELSLLISQMPSCNKFMFKDQSYKKLSSSLQHENSQIYGQSLLNSGNRGNEYGISNRQSIKNKNRTTSIVQENNLSIILDKQEDFVEDETKLSTIQKMPNDILSKGNSFYFSTGNDKQFQLNKYDNSQSENNSARQRSSTNISQQTQQMKIQGQNGMGMYEKQNTLTQSNQNNKRFQSSATLKSNSSSLPAPGHANPSRNHINTKNEAIPSISQIKSKYLSRIKSLYYHIQQKNDNSSLLQQILEDKNDTLTKQTSKLNNQQQIYQDFTFCAHFDRMYDFIYFFCNQNSIHQIKKYNTFNKGKNDLNKTKYTINSKKDKKSNY